MAQQSGSTAGVGNSAANKGPAGSGKTGERTRKVYDHKMTDAEKFALQTVQRAQGALRTINDAIKSGKTVNPAVVDLCFDLSKAVGTMLFAKP